MPSPLLLIAIGCTTGFLAGFLGAGGGFVTVVLLIAIGVPVHEAIGSSLVYIMLVAFWGTALHVRQKTASVPLALSLGLPSAATAAIGAQVAESFSDRTLTLLFGLLTAFVVVSMLRKQPVKVNVGAGGAEPEQPQPAFEPRGRPLALAIGGGAVIGIAQGLFGVGGGFLLVPYMLLVLRINENVAVGSSLFAILIGSVVGSLRHASLGNVDTHLLVYLVPAGFAGSFAGTRATKVAPPALLRRVFITLMVAATIYLVARSA